MSFLGASLEYLVFVFIITAVVRSTILGAFKDADSSFDQVLAVRSAQTVFFSPLSRYPGPWLWAAYRWPMLVVMWKGVLPFRIKQLHDQYGPVVRISLDELSFQSIDAWKDIYSNRDFNRPAPWRGRYPGASGDSLISAHSTDHARLRKVFSPAFSEKAVRGYESDIHHHLNILVQKLKNKTDSAQSATVDIIRWLNFFLFDAMMDIGWSGPFGLLEKGGYHPWVTAMQGYEERIIGACLNYYPLLQKLATVTMPEATKQALRMIRGIAEDNVEYRLNLKTDRPDVFANTLGPAMSLEKVGISHEEMTLNSMTYVVVGSEPVTTVLSAALHYLLQDRGRNALTTLTDEIRSAGVRPDELRYDHVASLPFLTAVIKEALRMCPPIPDCMRRQVPESGAIISGRPVPPGTTVSVSCWAMFATEQYFQHAKDFIPERWLEQPMLDSGRSSADFADKRDAFFPFSYGPRGCMGQTLAWMELRLTLCRLLLECDLMLPPTAETFEWTSQRILWEWDRRPLNVSLRTRV